MQDYGNRSATGRRVMQGIGQAVQCLSMSILKHDGAIERRATICRKTERRRLNME